MKFFESRYDEKEYFDTIDYLYDLLEENNAEFLTNLIFIQLVISLEVFIERLSKPLKKECKKFCMKHLPSRVKVEHSKGIINSLNDKLSSSLKIQDCESLFLDLSRIWVDEAHKIKLNFDLKFRSGKHGDEEIIKIFDKLGINNIFEELNIKDNKESSLLDVDDNIINAQLFIQELVAKRNLAIHQGVKLSSQFSIKEVSNKIFILKALLKEINRILDEYLGALYKESSRKSQQSQLFINDDKWFFY